MTKHITASLPMRSAIALTVNPVKPKTVKVPVVKKRQVFGKQGEEEEGCSELYPFKTNEQTPSSNIT